MTMAAIPAIQIPMQATANNIINQVFTPQAPTSTKAVAIPNKARAKT